MARTFIKIFCATLATIVTVGCTSMPYYWQKEKWAKETVEDAHAHCSAEARVDAAGPDHVVYDENNDHLWSESMKECMMGHGYTLVHGHNPAIDKKADSSRGTASAN
jgi:hypothetical protein